MSVPTREKEGMRLIVWTKIVYHHACMINTDKGQEGIASLIEARNKYKMLRTRKQRTAFITKVARIFKYSREYVITLLGKRKTEFGQKQSLCPVGDEELWGNSEAKLVGRA